MESLSKITLVAILTLIINLTPICMYFARYAHFWIIFSSIELFPISHGYFTPSFPKMFRDQFNQSNELLQMIFGPQIEMKSFSNWLRMFLVVAFNTPDDKIATMVSSKSTPKSRITARVISATVKHLKCFSYKTFN